MRAEFSPASFATALQVSLLNPNRVTRSVATSNTFAAVGARSGVEFATGNLRNLDSRGVVMPNSHLINTLYVHPNTLETQSISQAYNMLFIIWRVPSRRNCLNATSRQGRGQR